MLSWPLRATDWQHPRSFWPYDGCPLDRHDRRQAQTWSGLFADEHLNHFNGSEDPRSRDYSSALLVFKGLGNDLVDWPQSPNSFVATG
jgi:hypothetical protein